MQQQQSSDLQHSSLGQQQQQQQHQLQQQQQLQQQNGSVATGPPGGGSTIVGGTAPNSPPGSYGQTGKHAQMNGGRFDFEDGGTYCGGWEEGKAHGYGVCTGPKHQGAYAGAWNYGFEVSGVYIWPSGSSFEGQWQNGRRHGLGVEQRGRLLYRGEWTSGYKGRYGVRQSTTSTAKYEGTWANGLQDGYGSETYADGGSYQGQWQEGKRHGYGVRTSAPFGLASHYRPKNIHSSMSSLRSNENADPSDKRNHKMDDIRGGFVLKARSDEPPARRNSLTEKSKKGFLSGLKIRKQRSTGDLEKRGTGASGGGSLRSTVSTASWISTGSSQSGITTKSVHTDSNASFTVEEEQLDPSVVETYMGEWKRDKRDGYGISERSDGLKYEGEWHNNKKHGYGVTTFRDGTVEEGKYKNNILITSQKKKHLFLIRSRKFRERIEAAVSSAQRASKIALQKADIAISRTATARGKAEYADSAAEHARIDCETAVATARVFDPDFKSSVLERFERLRYRERYRPLPDIDQPPSNKLLATNSPSSQIGNKIESNRNQISETQNQQQQQPSQNSPNPPYQQNQSAAFQQTQQQSTGIGTRRTSMLTKQQSIDYSQVPNQMSSSLYSQGPQQDLSRQIGQQEVPNQMYSQSTHLQQNSPYQFQQQQPPGRMGNYLDSQQPPQQMPQRQNQMYGGGNYSNNPGMPSQSAQQMQQNYMQQQQPMQNSPQMHNTMPNQIYGNQMNPSTQQQLQQQQQYQFQQQQTSLDISGAGGPSSSLRRNSRLAGDKPPMLGAINQSSIDHFDHYKRPPSRDSSVDRYTRAASRMSGIGSRQPSVDRVATPTTTLPLSQETPERTRSGSVFRGPTMQPQNSTTGNGTVPTGTGGTSRSGTPSYQQHVKTSIEAAYVNPGQPFEDVLLRQRTLGQDIIPSPSQPKRTESLFVPQKPATPSRGGGGGGGGGKPKLKSIPINVSLQRKKSLPDFQELPRSSEAMSREEVSALGSARREEVRRQIENSERLKANPLLYLVSPQVKDWFSRQQLVLLVLIVNVALAIMFFKMLT